jgi:hypothetical protein
MVGAGGGEGLEIIGRVDVLPVQRHEGTVDVL